MEKYLKNTNFKVEVFFILLYYFGVFIFPTAVIDDNVVMFISALKSPDNLNHSNVDLLAAMSLSVSLVLLLSFILKHILLHKDLVFLAFLQMFLCMIYCLVALFYFKHILELFLSYNQIGLLYYVRYFCLLAILIVNYRSLRNLYKKENLYNQFSRKTSSHPI